jgi:hypothetical protein
MKFFMDRRIRIAKNKQIILKYNGTIVLPGNDSYYGTCCISEGNTEFKGLEFFKISYSIYNIYL